MNKTELIATMAEASGLSKKDCETAVATGKSSEGWQESAAGGLRCF